MFGTEQCFCSIAVLDDMHKFVDRLSSIELFRSF